MKQLILADKFIQIPDQLHEADDWISCSLPPLLITCEVIPIWLWQQMLARLGEGQSGVGVLLLSLQEGRTGSPVEAACPSGSL